MTKKMFFIATLLVAGLASANTQKNETETNKVKKKVSKKTSKVTYNHCVPIYLSCGEVTWKCNAKSVQEILDYTLLAEGALCSQ